MQMIRGLRGATTITENSGSEIVAATEVLLRKMIHENEVNPQFVASIFISVTEDITAEFPAKALRELDGWAGVPVMCMKEIPVPDSLQRCIRIMMHVNTDKSQKEIRHVYLEGAKQLRPDLNTL